MESKLKHNIIIVTFGIVLFVVLSNFGIVIKYTDKIINIIAPLIIGGVAAFVVSVPVTAYSKLLDKLSRKLNKTISYKVNNLASIILTILSLILVVGIVMLIVIPEIVKSVNIIAEQVKIKWPEWMTILESYDIDTKSISNYFNYNNIKDNIHKLGNIWSSVKGTASSTISIGANIIFSAITCFYILIFKKDLYRQFKKLMYANMNQEKADRIIDVAKLLKDTYTKFLVGQCKESAILGTLMLIALSLFRLPYAGLIAILTFICAFIPYIGAFISCGVGVFLTLLYSPQQAIVCLIVYQVVQFIEGQFIYPKVVGSSVGMLPIWTFVSVLIGGKLFGIVGILFVIPLAATLHILLSRDTNKKLQDKNININ